MTREPGDLPLIFGRVLGGVPRQRSSSSRLCANRQAGSGHCCTPDDSLEVQFLAQIDPADQTTVLVCITCRASADPVDAPRAGLALADATAKAANEFNNISVRPIRCLGNCSRGLSAAIRSPNCWTYIFGNLNPAVDGPALVAGAILLAGANDGIMPWRGRPDSLKRGLIARVPPISFLEENP